MKNKKAAMEMSVGTIVTIVLLMAVLVLGLTLVRNIFKSSKGAIDLTDEQLKSEIGKAFGDGENKIIVYPESRYLEIKQEERDAVGIGIRNLLEGVSGEQKFSYNIKVGESNCGSADVLGWIDLGRTEENIGIPVGEYASRKVRFYIPTGQPLCSVRYIISVTYGNNQDYETDFFDIAVEAK